MITTMAQFGNQLREARQNRGWSLEALSAETRVQLRHLEALEQEAFHELPGGIFRRGILRAYLHALQLEEREWMPPFEASVLEQARLRGESALPDDEAWVQFASNIKKNRGLRSRGTGLRWLGVLGLGVLLAAAGWAAWMVALAPRIAR